MVVQIAVDLPGILTTSLKRRIKKAAILRIDSRNCACEMEQVTSKLETKVHEGLFTCIEMFIRNGLFYNSKGSLKIHYPLTLR